MKNGLVKDKVNGFERWYLNDQLHREDGPALINIFTGSKSWYKYGLLHRESGPAFLNGLVKQWYLEGKNLTEDEFNQWLEKKQLNENLQSTLSPSEPSKRGKI